MNPTAVAAPRELGPRDQEIVRLCATNLLEIVPEFAVAMARHIHEQLPEMGGVEDEAALDATRRSCEGNLREIFIMLRAGLPATAHQTPSDALEYVRFLSARGVGLGTVLRCYRLGVSMLHPVMRRELERSAEDTKALTRMVEVVRMFVWVYVGRVTERLDVEFGDGSEHRVPPVDDPVWVNPPSHEAATAFLDELSRTSAGVTEPHARARAQAALQRFRMALETAARDERLTKRLTRADTTVRIELADEPDLALTALLQDGTIEVVPGGRPAEIDLSLSSVDLERVWSGDFNLAMAIARGRVAVDGPARKFLRVMPIIRRLARGDAPDLPEPGDARAVAPGNAFDAPTRALLDRASEFQYASGTPGYAEQERGYFWSIECRGVYKRVGRDPVLNGVDVGIPEGMITVVLGPSGTCKRVLVEHLRGEMLPDRGEVLVHGPEIVVLDVARRCEPIRQMHAEQGGTYIVITNDVESARRIADYLVVLWRGRVVQSGDRDDMFTSPNPFVRRFLAGRPQATD